MPGQDGQGEHVPSEVEEGIIGRDSVLRKSGEVVFASNWLLEYKIGGSSVRLL